MSREVPSHRAFSSETDRSISLQREAHELFLEDLLYHQATRSLRTELLRAQTPGCLCGNTYNNLAMGLISAHVHKKTTHPK